MSLSLLLALALTSYAQTLVAPKAPALSTWAPLELWLSQQAGVPSDPGSLPKLQQATAELLAADYGLKLETAVARAFASTRGLPRASAATLERSFTQADHFIRVPEGGVSAEERAKEASVQKRGEEFMQRVHVVERSHSNIFVSHDEALFRLEGERLWNAGRIVPIVPPSYVGHDPKVLDVFSDEAYALVVPSRDRSSQTDTMKILGRTVTMLPAGDWRLAAPGPHPLLRGLLPDLQAQDGKPPAGPSLSQSGDGSILRGGRAVFSRLVATLGLGMGERPKPTVWDELSHWTEEAAGTRLPPQIWRDATSRELRSRPDEPLEKAMARAGAAVGKLDAESATRLENFLSSDGFEPVRSISSTDATAAVHDGKLYVSNRPSLSVLEGRTWKVEPDLTHKFLGWVGGSEGVLYAATFEKLQAKLAGGWTTVFSPTDGGEYGPVMDAARFDGKLYIATTKGLFIAGEKERRFRGVSVRSLSIVGGRLVAATAEGAKDVELGTALSEVSSYFVKELGGAVYVGTPDGLYRGIQGKMPELQGVGYVRDLLKFQGRLYAATADGLYVKGGSGWSKHPASKSSLHGLIVYQDRLYAVGPGRVYQKHDAADVAAAWRVRAASSLAVSTDAPEPDADAAKLEADEAGTIVRRGRSIFNTMVSKLGAGMGVWEKLAQVSGVPEEAAPAWRARTLEAIRNEPGLSFEDAALKAVPDPSLEPRVTASWFPEPQPDLEGVGGVYDLKVLDGKMYAATDAGLFRREKGQWRRLYPMKAASVALIGDRLFISAPSDSAILSWKEGETDWRKEYRDAGRLVDEVADVGGRALAFTRVPAAISGEWDVRILMKGVGGWSKPVWTIGGLRQVVTFAGKTLALADRGLFELTWRGWRLRVPPEETGSLFHGTVSGGKLYFVGFNGLFSWNGKDLDRLGDLPASLNGVHGFVAIQDRLYLLGYDTVLEWTGKGWKTVLHQRAVKGGVDFEGRRWLRTDTKVLEWHEPVNAEPAALRKQALIDLSTDLQERSLAPDEDASSRESLTGGADGIVKSGRKIFSSLISKLGAGMEKPAGPYEPADPWNELSKWLKDAFGLELALDAWKLETARTLLDEPALGAEEALARGAARAAGLAFGQAQRFEGFLLSAGLDSGFPQPGARWVGGLAWHMGRVYAATRGGLYVLEDGKWKAEPSFGRQDIETVVSHEGRLYAAAFSRWHVRELGKWKPSFENKKSIHAAASLDGRLLYGTRDGLYVLEDAGPRALLPGIAVNGLAKSQGRILAATEKGLYEVLKDTAVPWGTDRRRTLFVRDHFGMTYVGTSAGLELDELGKRTVSLTGAGAMLDAAVVGGRLYASTSTGRWVKDYKAWKRVLPRESGLRRILKAGLDFFIETTDGGLVRWVPQPTLLPATWRAQTTGSLVPELERLAAEKAVESERRDEGLTEDGTGGIAGKDGRTIFSKLERPSQ